MKLDSRLIQGPVLSVRADTPISDAIAIMRQNKVGALLIVSDADGELEGIFTERDLLARVDLIQSTGTWNKPIVHVMTKNPRTVTLNQMPQIPKLMIQLGIRHVPVVEMVKGKKRPIGVISMRDCFRYLQEQGTFDSVFDLTPKDFNGKKRLKPIGILAKTPSIQKILLSSLGEDIQMTAISPTLNFDGNLPTELKGLGTLIVDIDGVTQNWPALIRKLNRPNFPPVVICYDPREHSEMELILLRQLKTAEHFQVFTRPLHLMEFVATITKLIS